MALGFTTILVEPATLTLGGYVMLHRDHVSIQVVSRTSVTRSYNSIDPWAMIQLIVILVEETVVARPTDTAGFR